MAVQRFCPVHGPVWLPWWEADELICPVADAQGRVCGRPFLTEVIYAQSGGPAHHVWMGIDQADRFLDWWCQEHFGDVPVA